MARTPFPNSGFIDFDALQALAERVEQQAHRADYNEEAFCDITSSALRSFDADIGFDPISIARFLGAPTAEQKAFLAFSDLPITLYSSRNFYIEALLWFNASTVIHSHGFCGSFKVIAGSSLHTRYIFSPKTQLSGKVASGKLECVSSELLQKGSVRSIKGGNEGLVHSLFHLEKPSISLLIRTHKSAVFQPQYVFYPPGLSLDHFALSKDPEVRLLSRLLSITSAHTPEQLEPLLYSTLPNLDFARLAYIMLENTRLLPNKPDLSDIWAHIKASHGEKSLFLREAFEIHSAKLRLLDLRKIVRAPDLRYFLACLLNAPDHTALNTLIKKRTPDDSAEFIAESLIGLAKLAPDPKLLLKAMANWNQHAQYDLPRHLSAILSDAEKAGYDPETWLRNLIHATTPSYCADKKQPADTATYNRLKQIDELAPIWSDS